MEVGTDVEIYEIDGVYRSSGSRKNRFSANCLLWNINFQMARLYLTTLWTV